MLANYAQSLECKFTNVKHYLNNWKKYWSEKTFLFLMLAFGVLAIAFCTNLY